MRKLPACVAALVTVVLFPSVAAGQSDEVLTGEAAYGDWTEDAPGVTRLFRPVDMPPPYATRFAANRSRIAPRASEIVPQAPDGFSVGLFADGLSGPRTLAIAPNGDVFVAESGAGRVLVFRPGEDGQPASRGVFVDGLSRPYGLAFYPPASGPEWLYVAEPGRVIRYPYRAGAMEAGGVPEIVVSTLPTGGHWTRDIAFSPDGSRLYVSVGSASNVAEDLPDLTPAALEELEAAHGIGAAWGGEEDRAVVLSFDPEGGDRSTFATGIRNCSGLAVQPATGDLWCATNERDGLGDNLPPDYVSRIRQGAFYGWPWYYIGDHRDPRHEGARPGLADDVTVPDVLIQPHSAPLALAFYNGDAFPEEYAGDAFATLHGSWNRSLRTGYKVVRVIIEDGEPTGAYQDFLTGFVLAPNAVWGRPTGVAVASDGALLVSEDGNGTIWRIGYPR